MSVVSWIVDDAQGFLDDAAETQFGAVAATVGTITTIGVTLVLIIVCVNMMFQYRAMDGRTAFWLGVKIALIGIFAQNWTQFNALSSSILNGIDPIELTPSTMNSAGWLAASIAARTPLMSLTTPVAVSLCVARTALMRCCVSLARTSA